MAFQIADDLLDYTSSQAITGKPTGHDLREHKVTLPLVDAMKRVNSAEMAEIRSLFDSPEPSDDQIQRVVAIVEERGGLDYARARAGYYGDLAEQALEGLARWLRRRCAPRFGLVCHSPSELISSGFTRN